MPLQIAGRGHHVTGTIVERIDENTPWAAIEKIAMLSCRRSPA
jgi:hypothetical protein